MRSYGADSRSIPMNSFAEGFCIEKEKFNHAGSDGSVGRIR